jgi:AraC-like DNA-binding protein
MLPEQSTRRFVLPERKLLLPVGICVEVYQPHPSDRLSPHAHDVDCMNLVLEGCIHEHRNDTRHELRDGSLSLLPAGNVHAVESGTRTASVLHLEFSAGFLARLPPRFAEGLPACCLHDGNSRALARRFREELLHADALSSLAFEALAIEALMHALREGTRPRLEVPPWLQHFATRWREDPGQPVQVAVHAQAMGLSPAALTRQFRRHFGQSIPDFVFTLRVDAASRLLESSEAPLAAIASRLGFADQSHFARAFQRAMGVAPGAYRERARRH